MPILERWLIFFVGTFFQSIGIALVVKSTLGTSPISSVPYVLSLSFPLTFGQTTFIINMLFLIAQLLLLKKNFNKLQFLQIPVTFVFATMIDVSTYLFANLSLEIYIYNFLFYLSAQLLYH